MLKKQINIFALPSQTNALFWLIVITLLGSIAIGSAEQKPIPIFFLMIGILCISFLAFLDTPERQIRRYGLVEVEGRFPRLEQSLVEQSKSIDLKRTPKLLISKKTPDLGLHTFGSFRHWYIGVGELSAQSLEDNLSRSDWHPVVQAQLWHELTHFQTGDYWRVGYVEKLLKATFGFVLWAMLFFMGWGILLILAKDAFIHFDVNEFVGRFQSLGPEFKTLLLQILPPAQEFEDLRQKARSIDLQRVLFFIVSSLLPYILLGGLLWTFYYRKLWRLRELYADVGAAYQLGDAIPLLAALKKINPVFLRSSIDLSAATISGKTLSVSVIGKIKRSFFSMKSLHPSDLSRMECLRNPYSIFEDTKNIALLIGFLILALDILLSSPLTLLVVGNYPMHFSTITVFVYVAINIIPLIIKNGRQARKDILRMVVTIMSLRLAWIVFTILLMLVLLLLSPGLLSDILCNAVGAVAGYAGFANTCYEDVSAFVLRSSLLNLSQVFVVGFILWLSFMALTHIVNLIMSWYGTPNPSKFLLRCMYAAIAWVSILLSLVVLPVITVILLRPDEFFGWTMFAMIFAGSLILFGGIWALISLNRRYGNKCPNPACGHMIKKGFDLQEPYCPKCQAELHPWLFRNYQTW